MKIASFSIQIITFEYLKETEMMEWFTKLISVVILMLCVGLEARPEDMMVERRMEINVEETFQFSEFKNTFTATDLSVVYDFLEKSFILVEQTDLPENLGLQKSRWICRAERHADERAVFKCHHASCHEEVCKFLSAKYIQGFYIYWINKLII